MTISASVLAQDRDAPCALGANESLFDESACDYTCTRELPVLSDFDADRDLVQVREVLLGGFLGVVRDPVGVAQG